MHPAARALAALAAVASACSSGQKAPPPQPAAAAPAVVIAQVDGGSRRLFAVPEDGSGAPVALTPAGSTAQLAGVVSGRRVVYATVGTDGTLLSIRRVAADGSGDQLLGLVEPSAFRAARGAWEIASRTVVQLTRADGSSELIATGEELPGIGHLASGRFALASADRVAYLANATSSVRPVGDLRSVRLDGSGDLALGGGDGDDLFHGASGGALIFTQHASGAAEVQSIAADGTGRVSRAGSLGQLFASGMLVASRGGQLERLDGKLAPTALGLPDGASPLVLRADGTVFAHAAGVGLFAADGKAAVKLDGFSADSAPAAQVAGDRIFYTANDSQGSHLRAARLDGSGAVELSFAQGHELLFNGLLGDRALFFRTAGTEIGGRLFTVALDGSGQQAVGDDATGTLRAADHDFGGLGKSGRAFFEAELTEHAPPRLFVLEGNGTVRALTASREYTSLSAFLN